MSMQKRPFAALVIPVAMMAALLGISGAAQASTTAAPANSHAVSHAAAAVTPQSTEGCPPCNEEHDGDLCFDPDSDELYECTYTPGGEWAWEFLYYIGSCPGAIHAAVTGIKPDAYIC
jgi:hypothetical protein